MFPSVLISNPTVTSVVASLLSIGYGLFLTSRVLSQPKGDKKMNEISDAITEGANAYMKKQYTVIAVIGVLIFGVLFFAYNFITAAGFAVGALFSSIAGVIGMNVAVRSNIRTAQAAKKGLAQAFSIAFSGGAVTGLMVAGLALLAVSGFYYVLSAVTKNPAPDLQPLIALGFGGSLISVFARLCGGIYTKSADVGTDMVGKLEKNIPEDDPRNPGVIADLVGDNVGDDAGMAADLFETYVITAVAAMILGELTFPGNQTIIYYPLLIGAVSIFASIIGSFFVKLSGKNIMMALYQGLIISAIIALIGFYFITVFIFPEKINFFYTAIIGVVLTIVLV